MKALRFQPEITFDDYDLTPMEERMLDELYLLRHNYYAWQADMLAAEHRIVEDWVIRQVWAMQWHGDPRDRNVLASEIREEMEEIGYGDLRRMSYVRLYNEYQEVLETAALLRLFGHTTQDETHREPKFPRYLIED